MKYASLCMSNNSNTDGYTILFILCRKLLPSRPINCKRRKGLLTND